MRNNTLLELLKKKNLTQNELAKITGISKGAISCYISGKYQPKLQNQLKIERALEIGFANPLSNLTPEEIELIYAYREHPELQAAIRRMLDIE